MQFDKQDAEAITYKITVKVIQDSSKGIQHEQMFESQSFEEVMIQARDMNRNVNTLYKLPNKLNQIPYDNTNATKNSEGRTKEEEGPNQGGITSM